MAFASSYSYLKDTQSIHTFERVFHLKQVYLTLENILQILKHAHIYNVVTSTLNTISLTQFYFSYSLQFLLSSQTIAVTVSETYCLVIS